MDGVFAVTSLDVTNGGALDESSVIFLCRSANRSAKIWLGMGRFAEGCVADDRVAVRTGTPAAQALTAPEPHC